MRSLATGLEIVTGGAWWGDAANRNEGRGT